MLFDLKKSIHCQTRPRIETRVYVGLIENFLASFLADQYGIAVIDDPPHAGAFVADKGEMPRKIGSIGIQLQHRVTMHGFALNLEEQVLPWFKNIVVCGMKDANMTSVETELKRFRPVHEPKPLVNAVSHIASAAAEMFGKSFLRSVEEVSEEEKQELLQLME